MLHYSPKVPVVLDVDPGHDDAMAIILAAHNPRINLLAISVRGSFSPVII